MGYQYEELPHWEFTLNEVSNGVYHLLAQRDNGIKGEGTGLDPDELLEEWRLWATEIEEQFT